MKTIRNLSKLTGYLVSKYGATEAQDVLLNTYGKQVSITQINLLTAQRDEAYAEHPAEVQQDALTAKLNKLRTIWATGNAKLKTLDGRTAQAKVIKAYLIKLISQGEALKAQGA